MLAAKADGECYRVRLHVAGADPRIALREDAALDEATVAALRARLDRLDASELLGSVDAADAAVDRRAALRPSARPGRLDGSRHAVVQGRRAQAQGTGPDDQPQPRLRALPARSGAARSALMPTRRRPLRSCRSPVASGVPVPRRSAWALEDCWLTKRARTETYERVAFVALVVIHLAHEQHDTGSCGHVIDVSLAPGDVGCRAALRLPVESRGGDRVVVVSGGRRNVSARLVQCHKEQVG